MPKLSERVGTFTDSVIRRMTRISDEYGAINLSQGFPDFDPPREMMDALAKAAYAGPHQYSVTFGAQTAITSGFSTAVKFVITPERIWINRSDSDGSSPQFRTFFSASGRSFISRSPVQSGWLTE